MQLQAPSAPTLSVALAEQLQPAPIAPFTPAPPTAAAAEQPALAQPILMQRSEAEPPLQRAEQEQLEPPRRKVHGADDRVGPTQPQQKAQFDDEDDGLETEIA